MKQRLKDYITQNFKTTPPEIEEVLEEFNEFTYNKKQVILNHGEVERKVHFINSGALRTYFIKDNHEEATRYIAFEGEFISCLSSFTQQVPSTEVLQAIEITKGLSIQRDPLLRLAEKIAFVKNIYTHRMEEAFSHNSFRIEALMTMTGKERYHYYLSKHGDIVNRLSNKILASYLGVTQESLSRIKADF